MNEVSETEERLSKRLLGAIALAQLTERPVFALTAEPTPSSRFPALFAGKDTPLVATFDHPPTLRRAGFDLEHSGNSRIVRGDLRRGLVQGFKVLELWRDGVLIYAVEAGFQPGWGNPVTDGGVRVNPLALAEPVYLFAELTRQIYEQSTVKPGRIAYRVSFSRLVENGELAKLSEGPLEPIFFESGEPFVAPGPEMERTVIWEHPEVDSGAVAYRLLQEVYHWFGISDSGIPYTRRIKETTTVVDPEELIKAGT